MHLLFMLLYVTFATEIYKIYSYANIREDIRS